MRSISIHGLDEEIERMIWERAKSEGKSVNKIVKELIAKALGVGERPPDHRSEFADLCGVWSEDDAAGFMSATADLERTDAEDWR